MKFSLLLHVNFFSNSEDSKMKGITAVVSIVLLLMITIGIIGVAFVFLSRTTEQGGQSVVNATEEQTGQYGVLFEIEGIEKGSVFIRNLGTVSMAKPKFYIDGSEISASGVNEISPGTIGVYTLAESEMLKTPEKMLKVSSGSITRITKTYYSDYTLLSCGFDGK